MRTGQALALSAQDTLWRGSERNLLKINKKGIIFYILF